MIGYGFQDTIVKSGVVLYSSLLHWNATMLLGNMARSVVDDDDGENNEMVALAKRMEKRAEQIRASTKSLLWNDTAGVFMASRGGKEEHVIDVWGNALAGALPGFLTASESKSIFVWFRERKTDLFYEGQIRETPSSTQHWESVWVNEKGVGEAAGATVQRYQNGGFWATPHHHVLPFLAIHDKEMACELLNDTIKSFRGHGINEWVGPFYPGDVAGAPGYVASAAGTAFASRQLRCWEE